MNNAKPRESITNRNTEVLLKSEQGKEDFNEII